ncbi:MAG TPA: amidohydrolase [Bacteroidia bacterium]|jgi:predicted amidohydrolase
MSDLKITIIQSFLEWENIPGNLKMFSHKIAMMKNETDLIILPEMFSTGFTMNTHKVGEAMSGKAVEWMKKTAKERNCVITGSVVIEEKGKFYNRLVWMRPDGSFETYNKRHLFRYANEQEHYTPGDKKLIVELKGWKICPLICYDLRFPVWSRNKSRAGIPAPKGEVEVALDYDLLIYVANWPERRNHPWKTLLLARAMENQCYVAGVNRVGNDGNDIYHSGDSAVINYRGEVLSKTKSKEEGVETVALSYSELLEFRQTFPAWMDADDFTIG